ncbi:adenine phosphoribosyltransferase domain protein, partial [Vibrio parahaemolyticus V-223/04]
SAT